METLDAADQRAAMGRGTVAVLGALREWCEQTPEDQAAFDGLCSETQPWLWRQDGALRFTKAH